MNFIPNAKFYESVVHLDPSTLAIAKARLNAIKTKKTTVIQNESIEDDIVQGLNKTTSSKNKSSNIFPSNYFDTLSNISSYKSESIERDVSGIENNDNSLNNVAKNSIVAAFCEGRGNAVGEIGLASIDLASPILYLSQFSDDLLYTALITKLQIHTPTEILVPKTILDANCKSIEKVQKIFFDLKITALPRRHFNEEEGMQMLLNYGLNECKSDIKTYEKRYYAISAASALFKYLKAINNITFMANALTIKFDGKFARMVLDYNTYNRLEILQPIFQAKENKACLLEILDRTVTQIGKRQIRAKILEPYLEVKDILFIQEAIKDFLHKAKTENVVGQISEILKKFHNVDQILKIALNDREEKDIIKSVQTMLDRILLIKTQLEHIPELHSALKPFQSYILYKAYTNLMDERFVKILKIIDNVLRPETQFIRGTGQSFQRIHAVRPGLNEYLDILRESYNNLTDFINESINQLGAEYGLPFRMTYSASKGFHIQLMKPKKRGEKLEIPAGLTLIYEKSNAMYLTTNAIIKLNVKLRETANEIYICSEKIIKKLTEDLIQYNEAYFLLVDIVANLDIIISYTKISQTDEFCCPKFGEETRVVEARHIFLENSKTSRICVPNNIIGTPEYNMFIITGPNMAGKTVYLKTIAIIQIIAQLGCYVPAKVAMFRICDKIFTRLGFDDRIEQNGSGFINEIREIEYIFKNITPRSLIIIDELCRTTNPVGGFNLAWKICSKLAQFEPNVEKNAMGNKSENENIFDSYDENIEMEDFMSKNAEIFKLPIPHIYISTHFLSLTKLKDKFFNVINLQVEAEETIDGENLSLNYTHKVKEGVTTIKNYGLKLAKIVGIPEEILKDAYDILNDIRMNSTKNENIATEPINESIEEIDILKKNLDDLFPNKSFQMQKKLNTHTSIASFMNNSDPAYIRPEKNIKYDACSNDLMQEFGFKMYDFYADIMTLRRHIPSYSPQEFQTKTKEIFEIVKESLPPELQNLLATKDMSSMLEESKNKNVNTSTKSNENDFLFQNNLQTFQDETKSLFNLVGNEKLSFSANINQFIIPNEVPVINEQNLKIKIEKKKNEKIKIIENFQIAPPLRDFETTDKRMENYENFFNLKPESSKNLKQLSNSIDFGILKSFECDLSFPKNSLELKSATPKEKESGNVRLNQTIDLGIFKDSYTK